MSSCEPRHCVFNNYLLSPPHPADEEMTSSPAKVPSICYLDGGMPAKKIEPALFNNCGQPPPQPPSAQQLYTMLFGAPTDDRSVDEEAHWRSDIVEWEAALAEGRRQLLNVWHCQSAPTENEFVVFTEYVVDEYCLRFDDMIAEYKLFFWWMWFRKTTMPPDATPAECAMPFLEQVDDPYKHNPTFNPRGKKQKVRLVKVSSIVSALSGDELVVAEAVRDIVEPGRKLRGWAYTVFSSSVAPLKLTRAAVLSKKVYYSNNRKFFFSKLLFKYTL